MSKGRVTRVLRRSRDLLSESKHWMKGDYKRSHANQYGSWNTYCMVGAIRESVLEVSREDRVTDVDLLLRETYLALAMELPGAAGRPVDGGYGSENVIVTFNDSEATTHEKVMEKLDLALKKADDLGL